MGEFIKPWWRKFAMLTLMMALAFWAGWVRSMICQDVFMWRIGTHSTAFCLSFDGLLICGIDPFSEYQSIPARAVWGSRPFCTLEGFISQGSLRQTYWQVYGFGAGQMMSMKGTPFNAWMIPYPPIFIPLTLIAFWLFVWTPRRSTSKKSTEPVPKKVA